ncbi:hypothetical protein BOX15_Mlig032448g1 [Macrostomum lignano]|uniref:Tyrosine-protein kinase n=1 Tax=Macrostomum lignano TaxID=282301 RepID=A0A267GQW6_9PLAT|nr:hypothetical protein BOX15_Mlig032448g1 [Macrostomum lignano]
MKFSCVNGRLQASASFSMTAIDVLGQCPEKSTKTIAVNPYVQQQQQAINRPISVQDKDQLQCHARVKHHQGTTGPIDPSNEAYFHGLMTPELAEERLLMMTSADDYSYEKPDGLFLLRSCLDGNFAVSALDSRSGSSVSHYPIVRAAETNGYRLASSRHSNGFDATFPGPVELIRGHPTMVKLARVPCPRPSGTSPVVLAQGVTADELTWSAGEDLLAGLHRRRPWYHEDCLDRAEAERRLASGGHVSGDFLVRQRRQQQVDDESSSSTPQRTSQSEFVLTLSWRREAWHYRILAWKSRPDWLAIEGANRGFRTLIELIDYYHLRRDGLMCRLRRPVTANAAAAAAEAAAELAKAESEVANDWEFLSGLEIGNPSPATNPNSRASHQSAPPSPAEPPVQLRRHRSAANRNSTAALQSTHASQSAARRRTLLDDIVNDSNTSSSTAVNIGIILSGDDLETGCHGNNEAAQVEVRQLRLVENVGSGRFGEMWRAEAAVEKKRVLPVAARVLPAAHSIASAASIALRSVEGLQHPNLLRLFGLAESYRASSGTSSDCCRRLVLLMEWASLGPADRHLRRHPECPSEHLLNLAHQVSQAMCYLESRGLAHRCLSARNVLLFPIWRAKISGDFGLFDGNGCRTDCMAAGDRGDVRRSADAAPPHLWHAPEALQHARFTCRSDVWSFGVTCWELFNRGRRLPFDQLPGNCSLTSQQLLTRLKSGERLVPPNDWCTAELRDLLLDC